MRSAILTMLLLTAVCFADYGVVGFSLSFKNDSTVAEIITDGPTDIKTINLTNPDRLIIDLIGGVHRLKTSDLPALPKSIVVEMRSAQYQAKPTPITRIVLVLAEPISDTRIENGPRGGKVMIPSARYPSFSHWSVGRDTPGAVPPSEKPVAKPSEPTPDRTLESIEARAETVATQTKPQSDSVLTELKHIDAKGREMTFVRPIVSYMGKEFRDPFIVAEPRKEREFGAEAVPDVDDLTLVGVVKSDNGNYLAILQDRNSWGYILGVGDTVSDGKVSAVTDSTVRFDVEEFGVIRPVSLELIKEN